MRITASPATRVELPEVEPDVLRAAVREVLAHQREEMPQAVLEQEALIGRLPSPAQLKAGAQESAKEEAEDARAAEYFQSLLELGYLAASADGLAEAEREALALLVEEATDCAVDRDMLRRHFKDLDAACAVLGRRERLGRIAANFEDAAARQEAMAFAALVAIADGALTPPEMGVLLELGEHLGLSDLQVGVAVDRVASSVKQALRK